MSYNCDYCGDSPPAGTKAIFIIAEVRTKGKPRGKLISSNVAIYVQPTEIVKIKKACPGCAMRHRDDQPKIVGHKEETDER